MKLYLLQQYTYRESDNGDLQDSDIIMIGIYDNIEIPNKIISEFVPTMYNAQYGSGLQNMFITEIEMNIQLAEPVNNISMTDFYSRGIDYYIEIEPEINLE